MGIINNTATDPNKILPLRYQWARGYYKQCKLTLTFSYVNNKYQYIANHYQDYNTAPSLHYLENPHH